MSITEEALTGDWRAEAACTDVAPDIFFAAELSVVDPQQALDIAAAKAVCAVCVSKEMCLEYALAVDIDKGIWGGLTTAERQPLRRAWVASHPQEI